MSNLLYVEMWQLNLNTACEYFWTPFSLFIHQPVRQYPNTLYTIKLYVVYKMYRFILSLIISTEFLVNWVSLRVAGKEPNSDRRDKLEFVKILCRLDCSFIEDPSRIQTHKNVRFYVPIQFWKQKASDTEPTTEMEKYILSYPFKKILSECCQVHP